jgi:hypothetical protein
MCGHIGESGQVHQVGHCTARNNFGIKNSIEIKTFEQFNLATIVKHFHLLL